VSLFGGEYKPSPVPLEGVVGAWTAANTRSGLSLAGGKVILTQDYLVFTPWDMDRTREWLFKLLAKAGAPDYVGKIDDLITKSRILEPVAIPLSKIDSIQVLNRASLLRPPTARLGLTDGRHFDLGILASPGTWNPSPKNNQAFDDWLRHMPQPVLH
jgi:hypothetical protein